MKTIPEGVEMEHTAWPQDHDVPSESWAGSARRRALPLGIAAVAALAVAALAVAALAYWDDLDFLVREVRVPRVEGLTVPEAEMKAKAFHPAFEVVVEESVRCSREAVGRIVHQDQFRDTVAQSKYLRVVVSQGAVPGTPPEQDCAFHNAFFDPEPIR